MGTLNLTNTTPRYLARTLILDATNAVGERRAALRAEIYNLREHVRLVERDMGLSLEISDALFSLETSSYGIDPEIQIP